MHQFWQWFITGAPGAPAPYVYVLAVLGTIALLEIQRWIQFHPQSDAGGILSAVVTPFRGFVARIPVIGPILALVLARYAIPDGYAIRLVLKGQVDREETPLQVPRTPIAPLLILLLPLFGACALSPIDRGKLALATAEQTLTAADHAFVAYSRNHQDDIVADARAACTILVDEAAFKACAEQKGRPLLDQWRRDRRAAEEAFAAAHLATAIAHQALALIEAGLKPETALGDVITALLDVVGKIPPLLATMGIGGAS